MIEIKYAATIIFILLGAFFLFIGSVGVIRLPDFFSRSHATSKSDTLGIMLIIAGMICYEGFSLNSLKLMIILIFIALTNPVASHALTRAAFKVGIKPWFNGKTRGDN